MHINLKCKMRNYMFPVDADLSVTDSSFSLMGVTFCDPPCNPPAFFLTGVVVGDFSGFIKC